MRNEDVLAIIDQTLSELRVLKKLHLQVILSEENQKVLPVEQLKQIASLIKVINQISALIDRFVKLRREVTKPEEAPVNVLFDVLRQDPETAVLLRNEEVRERVMEALRRLLNEQGEHKG